MVGNEVKEMVGDLPFPNTTLFTSVEVCPAKVGKVFDVSIFVFIVSNFLVLLTILSKSLTILPSNLFSSRFLAYFRSLFTANVIFLRAEKRVSNSLVYVRSIILSANV